MEKKKTARGFGYYDFEDSYGMKCSIQESSSGEENKIWLGIDEPTVKVLASAHPELTKETVGWVDVPLPSDVNIHGRMHLNREQVEALLPLLNHFAKTGDLP